MMHRHRASNYTIRKSGGLVSVGPFLAGATATPMPSRVARDGNVQPLMRRPHRVRQSQLQ